MLHNTLMSLEKHLKMGGTQEAAQPETQGTHPSSKADYIVVISCPSPLLNRIQLDIWINHIQD